MVIWLVGLSSAGKTTLGRQVYKLWKKSAPNTVFVDGDEIRRIFKHDQGQEAYSIEGRAANALRIAELCAWLDKQQINVVCAILSIFEDTRRWNRMTYSKYFEVYIAVPLEVLIQRDVKNLYRPAMRGVTKNVVGIDIPFVPPEAPDWIFDNSPEGIDPRAVAEEILGRAGVKIS